MFEEKALHELYQYQEKLLEISRYAEMFGGSASIGDKNLSLEEIKEEVNRVKQEISSRLSNKTHLDFLK